MKRCTECRRWFTAAATAPKHQRTCSAACRKKRRARHARERRLKSDLDETLLDERERQRKSRAAIGAAPRPAHRPDECHEPASDAKCLDLQAEFEEIVDTLVSRSLAQLPAAASRLLRKTQWFAAARGAAHGP